jgi:prepilin-type N-terminal cleavage/methylation domain-containing protein
MTMSRNRFSHSGFTLPELLVALAIFGLLMGMIFSSLGDNQRISAIARDEGEMNHNLQDTMSLMTSEIRCIGFPPSSYYDFDYLENPGSPKNLAAQGLIATGATFIKFQGDINGDQEVDYVHYYLSGNAAPYSLNRFGGSIHADGTLPGGSPQKISEQVEDLQFRYFDRLGNETVVVTEVVTIQIQLTLMTRKVDPNTGIYRTITEVTRFRPPNL